MKNQRPDQPPVVGEDNVRAAAELLACAWREMVEELFRRVAPDPKPTDSLSQGNHAAPLAEWMTSQQAADYSGRHQATVHRALESGELHGHQSGRGGRWQIKRAAVDAWITGTVEGRMACGCVHPRLKRNRP